MTIVSYAERKMSELINAKALLQKRSADTGQNLYDHLTMLIRKIIVEQPDNAMDYIEEYSRQLKKEYYNQETFFRDAYQPPIDIELSIKWSKLLQIPPSNEKNLRTDDESIVKPIHPNVMELLHYLEQAGVAIPPHEMLCLGICINQFKEKVNADKIRYWGKIYGTQKNYYVLEVTLTEDNEEEIEGDEDIEDNNKDVETEEKESEVADFAHSAQIPTITPEGIFSKIKIPPIPKVSKIKTAIVPPEKPGYGANSKVYYVCNELGDEWIRLPDVTPSEIVAARKLKRFFTGDLDAKVITYPPFPGDEKNLLRAQIARISASTQISPLGFFSADEEEDEDAKRQLLENEEYEAISTDDLIDPSMAFWVHHHPYILNQGRTTWWNPKENIEDEEESEEESVDAADEEQPETGLPLLTPLSEDAMIGETAPWTAYLSSKMLPEWSIAVVRSNLWPGALAYCTTMSPQKFENFYLGWGQKFSNQCYSPPPLPKIQFEYQSGPEIMEMLDPTLAEEEAVRNAKEKRNKKEEVKEEEDEEEELDEDEEEDEEEDDD